MKFSPASGCGKVAGNSQSATWTVPSYRRDLQRDVDLIEEVLRAYGIDKVPGKTRGRFISTSDADRLHDVETFVLRERLIAAGLSEVRTSKLISRSAAVPGKAIELRNPLSEDHVALRPTPDQRFTRSARTQYSRGSRECFHPRNGPRIHPTSRKRGATPRNFALGKWDQHSQLAITGWTQTRLVRSEGCFGMRCSRSVVSVGTIR